MKKKILPVIAVIAVIILIIAIFAVSTLVKKYTPSKERMDLFDYYSLSSSEEIAIVLNQEKIETKATIINNEKYLDYNFVHDYINPRFYWDENENVLLYTLPKGMVSVEVGSKNYTIAKSAQSEEYVILKTEGRTAFIALDFVKKYTDIEYHVYEDPNRVMIQTDWENLTVATVKKDTQVRYRGGVKSPVLCEISKQDEVTIVESEENWKKVCTKDGFIGYVKNNTLKKEEQRSVQRNFDYSEQEFSSITKDYKINMAWHNVTNTTANDSVAQRIVQTKGLTTIAPTWYHVADTTGNLESISSTDYVSYAHQAHIEVWATIRDFDGGISSYEESYEFLSRTSQRERLINQLIADALQTGIDGINVDFEKISEECGEHYIQFIRELSIRCKQNGLVLSVDNYVPKGYNMQYDRKEQGVVADYVVIMGYDEYFAGSLEAGSVSSYNFVKEGIEETMKEVPAEKIISGIPFFTRLWEETPKTEQEIADAAGTDEEKYLTNVDSVALGMDAAKETVEKNQAEIVWDEEAKQEFATWTSGDVTYKIWLENAKSLEPKLALMKENNLAGSAAWTLGQETPDIWELILQYTN